MPARRNYIPIIILAGIVLLMSQISLAEESRNDSPKSTAASVTKSATAAKPAADITTATNKYKATVEALIPIYESALKTATEKSETLSRLHQHGLVSKKDVEAGEKAVKEAQRTLDEARRQLEESDLLIAHLKAERDLARSAPTSRGYTTQSAVLRYNGATRWSLSLVSKVKEFFTSKFSRHLPISALGQSATHTRMGFDHRNSVDVAVHPDSGEGKALIAFLQSNGIPFIAFRAAVPGSATGAHIHIGYPSGKR